MLLSKSQSYSPQLLPPVALQSCYRKPRPKNAPQNSNVVTRSCLKAGPESCPKLFPKATGLCFKPVPQSYSPKRLPKAAPPKLLPKAAVLQSCSTKLLPKAAPQSCSPALLHKVVPKAILQSCCPKAAESCSPKLPLPEAASWSGKLSKVAPQSCYPKLFPGAAPQSCAPKLFSKAVALKLRFCKPVHQNSSAKPFCKAAPESCASKLLPEAAVQSYCPKAATFQTYTPKRLPKAILQSDSRKLLPKVAPQSCGSSKLLPKAAPQSCSPALLHKVVPKAVLQSCCPKAGILQTSVYQKCLPQSHSAKSAPESLQALKVRLSAAPESCFRKRLLKALVFGKLLPKAVVLQSNCPSMLLQCRKVAPHSCSPTSESCFPKHLCKTVAPKGQRRIRKLQRRIRKLPGPRIRKLAVPRIRKLQRRIRKLPGPRIRKLAAPRIRKLPGPRIRKLPGPRIRKLAVPRIRKLQRRMTETSRPSDSETRCSPDSGIPFHVGPWGGKFRKTCDRDKNAIKGRDLHWGIPLHVGLWGGSLENN